MYKEMIVNVIKLLVNTSFGFIVSFINIKTWIENFTDIANGLIGVAVGIMSFIYMYYQIKKIKKNLKK